MSNAKPSIDTLTSAVFDNGSRGNPKPGCDCITCFGYCLTDADKACRDLADRNRGQVNGGRTSIVAELDFEA